MSNIMAGSLNGYFPKLSNKLEVVSLLVNNSCNLSCKHCYLQTSMFNKYLTHREWMQFLSSVLTDISPSVVCFAGKEVFFNHNSVSILLDAVNLRNQIQQSVNPTTQIGVITNATLLHRYTARLKEIQPDYIDISIDGLPEIHDSIRGKGAFAKLVPNLIWLSENFIGNIWITHTLLANNLNTLPEFIKYYHSNFGIQKYSIGLYKDMQYTDPHLKLGNSRYFELVDHILPGLSSLNLSTPVEVTLELDTPHLDLIEILIKNGWGNPVDPISSVVHEFDNGLRLRIDLARIPVGLWRSVRVTPEGFWLAAEDLMRVREYPQVAVANLRDYHYNAKKLYQAGISSQKFTEIMAKIKSFPEILQDKAKFPFTSEQLSEISL